MVLPTTKESKMIRINVPAFKLETSSSEQTITHLDGFPIEPVTFKNVTSLGLGTVLVYPVDGGDAVVLKESSRVHLRV